MSSKPVSRLPQLSSFRIPVATTDRKRPASDEHKAVEKKPRKSDPEPKAHPRMLPPAKRAPVSKLRRSVSMANLPPATALRLQKPVRPKPTKTLPKRDSSSNLFNRQSAVTHSIITRNRHNSASERNPAANITNRINNVSSEGAKTDAKAIKGKSKRPGWDVKGRLIDMEELLKETTSKLSNYDMRMASLEEEKATLSENLAVTNTQKQSNEQEVAYLHKQLSEANEKTIKNRQEIRELEVDRNSLQLQVDNLRGELTTKLTEVASLNASVVQLVSSRAGLEAEHSSTKLLLDNHIQEVKELKCKCENQVTTLQELNEKLMQGESERRRLHNTVQELKGNIRVYCRVRPLLKDEVERSARNDVIPHINFINEKTLELLKADSLDNTTGGDLKGKGNYEFKFDRIFTPRENQSEVFEEISQLVQSALDGYNVCVFAYGQTGSGKTFTMEGVYEDSHREGMIPRSVRQIFQSIEQLNEKGWNYKVEASFLEIYNETIRDLLASPREAKNTTYDIKLTDGKTTEVYVSNLKTIPVCNVDTVHQLLNVAQQHRAVAATNLNERSSRSHSVFRLKLTGHNDKTGELCEGTVNLIDLAGSERLKSSGSEGARLTETQNINKSLANLSNVILALAQKQSHIPYRNSKLTHLLQNCLGGNSKTLMLVAVSPLISHFGETVNSLRFAVKVNQCHIGTATRQIRR